jgi:hypothetical protein
MRETRCNSSDGHCQRKCWRCSKMATQPEKAVGVCVPFHKVCEHLPEGVTGRKSLPWCHKNAWSFSFNDISFIYSWCLVFAKCTFKTAEVTPDQCTQMYLKEVPAHRQKNAVPTLKPLTSRVRWTHTHTHTHKILEKIRALSYQRRMGEPLKITWTSIQRRQKICFQNLKRNIEELYHPIEWEEEILWRYFKTDIKKNATSPN